ncbi:MAG: single-stranded DNA-binding protein [Actinomycetota bacterium]|nr:single-stranded DNA-binding protein [Actinomycetota bacterium]
MNIAVLQGSLSREPQARVMPAGGEVIEYEVRVRVDERRTETVPVVWHEAPVSAATLSAGTEVTVIGRVRRRFFRAGGATQSRTEVVAELVVSSRSRRRVTAAVDRAVDELQGMVRV